jgi:hypothetical protein
MPYGCMHIAVNIVLFENSMAIKELTACHFI